MSVSSYRASTHLPRCEIGGWFVYFAKVRLEAGAVLVGVRRRVSGGNLEPIPLRELQATVKELPSNILVKDEMLELAYPISETEHLNLVERIGLLHEPEHQGRPCSPEGEWNGA